MKEKQILCIDLKSFYATVECVLRNVDPFKTPLVVADPKRDGGIVLAVSPYLRNQGYPSRSRLYEVPKTKDLIIAIPRMKTYVDYAIKVIDIYLDFVSEEDLFIYSIDEVFLDVTAYLKYYNMTSEQIAKKILNKIRTKLGLYATCGIGTNMLLAKLSLDLESKYNKDFLAKWEEKDIKEKLWPLTPLSKMWGIGRKMEANLNRLGINNVGDLANYNPEKLRKLFGVIGVELYNHANGRDRSLIQDQKNLKPINARYSVGQVLFKDYNFKEAILIIKEMTEEVSRRLRLNKKLASVVVISVGYTRKVGGGFSKQRKMERASNIPSMLFKAILELYYENIEDYPIRRITIGVSNLNTMKITQLDLFTNYAREELENSVEEVIDEIKYNYGKNSVNKATSLLDYSTQIRRNETIGGHNA